MSASTTDKQHKTPTKAMLTKAIAPFVEDLHKLASAIADHESALVTLRVSLGAVAGRAIAALTTAGASAEEALTRVMGELTVAHLDPETVQAWIRASVVRDTLPESVQDAFGVDALVALGRIAPGKGEDGSPTYDDRVTLAESLADEGTTSVRAVREAVKATKGDGSPKGTTKGAKALVTKLTPDGEALVALIAAAGIGWTPEVQDAVNAAVMLGVRIGREGKQPLGSHRTAGETLAYFGPEGEEDEGDK